MGGAPSSFVHRYPREWMNQKKKRRGGEQEQIQSAPFMLTHVPNSNEWCHIMYTPIKGLRQWCGCCGKTVAGSNRTRLQQVCTSTTLPVFR